MKRNQSNLDKYEYSKYKEQEKYDVSVGWSADSEW